MADTEMSIFKNTALLKLSQKCLKSAMVVFENAVIIVQEYLWHLKLHTRNFDMLTLDSLELLLSIRQLNYPRAEVIKS